MELHLMHFLIVCPLVFLAGFVDAVAGGGGLISLPAYMIAGLPVHFAIGTNKLSSGMGTTLATALLCEKRLYCLEERASLYRYSSHRFLSRRKTCSAVRRLLF